MNAISLSDPTAFANRPPDHPPVRSGSVGVLLVNLGTPDATDAKSVRRYLKEFLRDKRVIEEDTITWKFVLNAIILPLRPGRKGLDYEKIWNRDKNESPLKTITRSQAEKLTAALTQHGKRVAVDWAMRYGNPSIHSRISALTAQGCDRILVVPLYPQYSAATSGNRLRRGLSRAHRRCARSRRCGCRRLISTIRSTSRRWPSSFESHLARLTFQPEVIVASLPRHAAGLFRQGRSLFIANAPATTDACCATAWARRARNWC